MKKKEKCKESIKLRKLRYKSKVLLGLLIDIVKLEELCDDLEERCSDLERQCLTMGAMLGVKFDSV